MQSASPVSEKESRRSLDFLSGYDVGALALILLALGWKGENEFLDQLTVFVLSCFVGYMVVWSNDALSTYALDERYQCRSIILVRWWHALRYGAEPWADTKGILAGMAIFLATIRVAGGFLVTHRMLKMFRKGMTTGLVTTAYLVSGILFVLSLGGLSKQEARKGNLYGILGMALAILATFVKITLDGDAGEINFQFLAPLMIGGQ